MNQGCIPSLFSITGIYVTVLFYFVFKEKISCSMIMGVLAMIPCVIFLSLDKKVESEESDLTKDQLVMYGGLAVLMGLSAPLFWTFRTYFTRRTINDKSYEINDLAIDTVLC